MTFWSQHWPTTTDTILKGTTWGAGYSSDGTASFYLNDTNFGFYAVAVHRHPGLLHHPLLDGIRNVGHH